METVSFTSMEEGTREDYELLERLHSPLIEGTAERVLDHLESLAHSSSGFKIDRLQHSLQSATLASRDGADEETVVVALLHDIGDMLAPANHAEFAATILRPYVSESNTWLVKQHGLFQRYYFAHHMGGDRNVRERYRGHPCFEATVDFCHRYDQNAFDPAIDTMPMEAFAPMVHRIFAREPFSASGPAIDEVAAA